MGKNERALVLWQGHLSKGFYQPCQRTRAFFIWHIASWLGLKYPKNRGHLGICHIVNIYQKMDITSAEKRNIIFVGYVRKYMIAIQEKNT